ncbi:cobyric acid synthase [Halovenus salina]|uniref:Probable cobyric acid synthase n=1 Tax=Halovenus salina TaxID=1510225 RepID=A0ABD5VZZ7_9EURY|nr:cobyric acid synthase [Halovenus salina]
MAETLLVAGTASHVGKSTVVAGLCRLLADAGVDVAPFKAQNMSNNARAVVSGDDWGEIGVSQYVQARAAGITPTTDLNPVLLKPRGDTESQLVLDGEAVGHYDAGSYYERHWEEALEAAVDAYNRLAAEHEVIVAEGAGSIAEINLHDRDLANVETARFADASVLLVGDIERGGVFASLYGTLELLPEDLRDRVAGTLITKFRGDPTLLEPGIEELESLTGVPVVGVLPYKDPGLPAEDSVSLPPEGQRAVRGEDDYPPAQSVTVGVPRLPHISNFTDMEPLRNAPGVRVAYLPLYTPSLDADAVVIPGTKNTVDDLLALKAAGFDEHLTAFEGPIVGICGGYQMLGREITNAAVESTAAHDRVEGLGLLPVKTRFQSDKAVRQTTVSVEGTGPIAGATGRATGYEIHMGRTTQLTDAAEPLDDGSTATESVLGTYLHGLFENRAIREAFLDVVFERANKERPATAENRESPYDAAAALVSDIDSDWLAAELGYPADGTVSPT